jgi:hypothetical protein
VACWASRRILGDRLALVRAAAAGVLVVAGVCVDLEVGVALAGLVTSIDSLGLCRLKSRRVDLAGLDALAEAELWTCSRSLHLAAGRLEPHAGSPGIGGWPPGGRP